MKKLTSAIISLSLVTNAWGVAIDCNLNTTKLEKRIQLPSAPNYFISADPSGKYTAVIDSYEENILVDMDTGKHQKVPGDVDPVFTPDSKFLTLPGGEFYDMREIAPKMARNQSARNVDAAFDAREGGVYQSIGILPGSTERKKTYRYMDDGAGASYFDVEMTFDSSGKMTNSRRKTDQKKLCSEASDRDTPMMSKDGKYLSILNFETYTTQIWRVNDNGSCDMMVDIGVPTGKVDFGFDNDNPQITFHVDEIRNDWRYFSGVSSGQRKSVFVMDLEKQKPGSSNEKWNVTNMAKVVPPQTEGLGSGSYYPRFRSDGTLVTVTQDGSEDKYYLDVVATQSLNFEPFNPEVLSGRVNIEGSADCNDASKKQFQSLVALGWLWADTCTSYGDQLRNVDLSLIPIGMNRAACVEMVTKTWNSKVDEFRGEGRLMPRGNNTGWTDPREALTEQVRMLSVDDLLAACPDGEASTDISGVEVIGSHNEDRGPMSVEKVVSRRCIGCHESRNVSLTQDGVERSDVNGPFIDFANINSAEDAMVWRNRIFNPQPRSSAMPPPDDLDGDGEISEAEFQKSLKENFSEQELNTLREKLRAIEAGQEQWNWGGE
tara:strand:- start:94057 stop:95865 length:1809 start_codon:yes stop_codon:yes gene_type:complete